jgi:PAS domain S-box-containing protein
VTARRAEAPRPIRLTRAGGNADHFRVMADFAPVMIWLASPDMGLAYVNRAWLDFSGGSLDEELCAGRAGGIHPDDRAECLAAIAGAFARREAFEVRYRARRRDGEYRLLLDNGVPLANGPRFEGYVGSRLDITDQAREDEKRTVQLERERSARANAESVALARDQFLAIVSHELRSPLNGIKSWAHVLEGQLREADPTVRRAIEGIMIGVEHQVRLIDDLLDVTRALSGNLGLAKESMQVLPVLAEAVESLRALASEKGLALVTEYGVFDREIHGDPDRVRQIFVNLLTNAVKFTPAGGTIWITARIEGAMAVVEIRDNGAGISPEFAPYLFDPFRQADQGASRRRQDGLGLGLALVQRLAELHGGKVSCTSEGVNRGATFRVHLPLLDEGGARVVIAQRADEAATSSLPSLEGVGVLVIDDQREAREALAELLHQAGASVAVASSGAEAIGKLEAEAADGRQAQVIVCDIAMPGEDGYAALKRIRTWEKSRPGGAARHPAIALTAFTQRQDRIRALSEGFQVHLTKPVAPAELVAVIASIARGMRL